MGWRLLLDLRLKGEKPCRHTGILLAEVTGDRSPVSRLKWPFCLPQIYGLPDVGVSFCLGSSSLNDACHLQTASVTDTARWVMPSHLWSWPSKAASVALIRVRPGARGEQTCFLQNLIFHLNLPYVPLRSLSPCSLVHWDHLLFENT